MSLSHRNIDFGVMSPGPKTAVHVVPTFDNLEEGEKSSENDREHAHPISYEKTADYRTENEENYSIKE